MRGGWSGSSDHWRLRRLRDGRVVGWRATFRRAEKDGRFRGLEVDLVRAANGRTTILWEHWTLDASATHGSYEAGLFPAAPRRRVRLETIWDTDIELDNRNLSVKQRPLGPMGRTIESKSPAPDNYIPEGLLPLTCVLVARDRTEAQFKLILNHELPRKLRHGFSTVPRFIDVKIRYLAPPKGAVQGTAAAAEVTLGPAARPMDKYTHLYDETGKTLVVLRGRAVAESAATWPEVRREFPTAIVPLRMLAEVLKFPLPASLTAPAEPSPETPPSPAPEPTASR